ncbi:helix-turn-helix transcriptional regulator [uncultured Acetobacteroides sp.]|uniref:helix-turn-helix domain-containing protein n=1 Tax=uncultured Acetobacteroides sp. TaxID=1760811 RepID=UPI0029F52A6D|nr:helix-turn-helix transcriptional regulator [uncultured Acetobacteroides sp.]
MICYNLERIILLRGHSKPVAFLQSKGFPYYKCHRMLSNPKMVSFKELERLCKLLHCTPNDLMEWIPDKKRTPESDHPLDKLRRNQASEAKLKALIQSIPTDKVEEASELLSNLCNEK